ncbi:polysaccharide deacetylase family protein, partial [Jatrophihabitans sp.]|uniref:polysaccharide deacetylase family protein n=1 Tax=Jatrophihabitans sp. TaxID=1932789 RepID=UPI0030C6F524|nr:nodB [Jatrophihabitans sp.]
MNNDSTTGPASGPSRRRLLRLGLLAAGAGAVAIPAGTLGGYDLASAADLRHRLRTGRGTPPADFLRSENLEQIAPAVASSSPSPSASIDGPAEATPSHSAGRTHVAAAKPPPRPVWLSTWSKPVSSLDDFLARSRDTQLSRNAIMLTIDDGPSEEWTPKYLRLLAKHHVQATFCVIGQQVVQFPHLVKAAVDEGHHIANHTYRHPLTLPKLSTSRIKAELEETTDAIVRATGFRPRQFRAPGGEWGAKVFAEVARQEMLPLGWDI